MTNIMNPNVDVRTVSPNSTTQITLQATDEGIIELPSTLTNAMLNFNFTLNDEPVITGITGSLIVTGQYYDSPITAIATLNLATTNNYLVVGKYTQLNITLSSLAGADTLIIYADQNMNIVNVQGDGSGATALSFNSPDGSLDGSATYDSGTQTLFLTAELTNDTPTRIYVSNQGSDINGSGSIGSAYATISHANTIINDNSSTKPYIIDCAPGVYSDTDYSPKPYVALELNGSPYTITNQMVLDDGWIGSSGILTINNSNNLILSGGALLDFNATGSPEVLVRCNNIITGNATLYEIIGNSTGTTIVLLDGIFGTAAQASLSILNCYGGITGGALSDISIIHTSETTGGNFTLAGVLELGDLSISDDTTVGMTCFITTNKAIGASLFTASGAGALTIISTAAINLDIVTLDGTNINFIVDTLQNLPTLVNGATYNPTSIADGMNANYPSPTNYTPIDISVKGHLIGINNALTGIGTNTSPTLVYVSNFGSDVTGNGSILNPYETITYANSIITDASISKPYEIFCIPGVYSDTDFSPKPFIALNLNSSIYDVVNQIVLDSSWNGASGILTIKNGGLLPQGNVSLDFNITASPDVLVQLFNLTTTTYNPLFSINGYANGNNKLIVENIKGNISPVGNQIIFTIADFDSFIDNLFCFEFTHQKTSATTLNRNISYINNIITTANSNDFILSNGSSDDTLVYLTGCNASDIIYEALSTGQLSIYETSMKNPSSVVTLFGPVSWYIDILYNNPILQGGATFTPSAIATGMNAVITPINYTPTDSSVTGNLEGIDNALGSMGTVTDVSSANSDIGVSNNTTTPLLTLNSGISPGQIVKLDGAGALPAIPSGNTTVINPTTLVSDNLQDTLDDISINAAAIATQAQTDTGYSSVLAMGVAQTKIYNSKNSFLPTVWGTPQGKYIGSSQWYLQNKPNDQSLTAVAFSKKLGLLCAVSEFTGYGNNVVTTLDGINWTTQTTSTDEYRLAICWADDREEFCIVGDTDEVLVSPDGITWTAHTASANLSWNGICRAKEIGLYCAVGNLGNIMTSPDGVTWTGQTGPNTSNLAAVTWSPELLLFCAVNFAGAAITSPNGVTWTLQTTPATNRLLSVSWSPLRKIFCAVGYDGNIVTSPDGATWTLQTSPTANRLYGVCWADEVNYFYAISDSAEIILSPDGVTWDLINILSLSYRGMCWNPQLGLLCAVSVDNQTDNILLSSSTWSYIPDSKIATSISLADASGAALSITTNYCTYTYNSITREICFNASITYPSTINASAVAISGLPGPAVPANQYLLNYFASTGSIATTPIYAKFSGSNIILVNSTNAAIINSVISGGTFQIKGSYNI